MIQLTPALLGILLLLTGVLAGTLVTLLVGRQGRVRLQTAHALDHSLLQQHEARIARLQQEVLEAAQRYAELDTTKDDLDRQLARSQSQEQSLQERLHEVRQSLTHKEELERQAAERLIELERELATLKAGHAEKLASYEELKRNVEQSGKQLKLEFENLANLVLEEKGKTFAATSQASLDALLKPFREQIQGFQQRVNQVHDEAVKGNASLSTEIRQMLEIGLKMSAEANTLTSALKGDKKTTGNWGEIQLEKALQMAGLIKGAHYDAQPRFQDGDGGYRHPDFVVKLPDDKHMVLDSKVSLVDYDRAIGADTEAERLAALDEHVRAVRNHIDDLSKKDYSNLIGVRSPSFVLMFMPIEPAYIEALKHNRDLFNYGYQKNVIMVSHTTLMPILKTVANLWMVARSNEQAHQLSERAGDIYNQIVVVAENLKRLGDTLGTVSNHYNRTVTSLAGRQGLYGKAQRFNELSSKANKTMPALEPLHKDFDTERLELIAVATDPSSEAVSEEPGSAGDVSEEFDSAGNTPDALDIASNASDELDVAGGTPKELGAAGDGSVDVNVGGTQ